MTIMKLIDKDALVAEIEKMVSNGKTKCQLSIQINDHDSYVAWSEHIATCGKILSFLNTLEVKEADLEKEINLWFDYGFPNDDEFLDYIKETAKHFYELGLKAQKDSELTQKDISIIYGLVIDAVYEQMRCKNPSFEGKDIYQEVLKRFKAQKGE